MRKKTHPLHGFSLEKAMNLIKSKFQNSQETSFLKKQKTNNKSSSNLSLSEMALICIYKNENVSNENAQTILNEFGSSFKSNGLVKEYNSYLRKSTRLDLGSKAKNKHHLKRLENVIEYLTKNDLPTSQAEDELELLKENTENYI